MAAVHLLVQDVFPLEACTASRFRVDLLFEADCKNFEVLKNREDSSDFDDSWTKSIAAARSSFDAPTRRRVDASTRRIRFTKVVKNGVLLSPATKTNHQ